MTTDVDGCLWISPGHVGPQSPLTSAQKFAAGVTTGCEVAVLGLRVWELGPADPYDLTTEVTAVRGAQHPTLAMSGALSHPRFTELAQRLVDVMPQASSITFPGSSHLSPPHRVAPEQLEQQLSRLWASRE